MIEKLVAMLNEIGVPFAYDHFAEGEAPDPPFICYLLPGSDNFAADGQVYYKINEVHIELYSDSKDPALENRVEPFLQRSRRYFLQYGIPSKMWLPQW